MGAIISSANSVRAINFTLFLLNEVRILKTMLHGYGARYLSKRS
jgi:hypothetical protein